MSSNSARYELIESLGHGSYATVHRGRDNELHREVAIKAIHSEFRSDPQQLEQYWREAQLLASSNNPNIITIFDIDREQGWLILELMQSNLQELMAGRPMSLNSIRNTLVRALRALESLHSRGIIHGDIKPTNLMVDGRQRLKLGDFGLARRVSDQDGSVVKGTTKYIAPEVISDECGKIGPSSDLYSLGFTAYELLCGSHFHTLFPGMDAFGRNQQMAWMMWHASTDRKLPPISEVLEGVPEDLQTVIDRLCAKDQSIRYQNANEALTDLGKVSRSGDAGKGTPEKKEDELNSSVKSDQRTRLLLAGSALGISLVMSFIMLLMPAKNTSTSENKVKQKVGIVRDVVVNENKVILENPVTGIPNEIVLGKNPHLFLVNTQKHILLKEVLPGDQFVITPPKNSGEEKNLEINISRPMNSTGVIKEIDQRANQIILSIREGEIRGDVPLDVVKNTEFNLNGQKCLLKNLLMGDRVSANHLEKLDHTGQRLQKLNAWRRSETVGYVSEIADKFQTITLNRPLGARSETLILPLSESCAVSRSGKTIDRKELKAGQRVRIEFDSEIHRIEVAGGAKYLTGYLESIDDSKKLLTIKADNGDQNVYAIANNCDITLGQQSIDFQSLRPTDKLTITYSSKKDPEKQRTIYTIDAVRPPRFDRWAIILGTGTFQDPYLSPLPHTDRDLDLIHDTLLYRYAVPPNRLLDLRSTSKSETVSQLEALMAKVNPYTQLVVYIAGHAYQDTKGAIYYAPYDFQWKDMKETGISINWLFQLVDKCAAKNKYVLFDCTQSGSGIDLGSELSAEEVFSKSADSIKKGSPVIGSCSLGERGMLSANRLNSFFAQTVANGLGGAADSDKNIEISSEELFQFLKTKMNEFKAKDGRKQTPVLWSHQKEPTKDKKTKKE